MADNHNSTETADVLGTAFSCLPMIVTAEYFSNPRLVKFLQFFQPQVDFNVEVFLRFFRLKKLKEKVSSLHGNRQKLIFNTVTK